MQQALSWRGWVCVWLSSLVLLGGCNRNERLSAQAGDAWSAVISAHTSGIVSRKSDVRVLFASDVMPEIGAKVDIRSLLTIEPAVEGELQFKGPRELAFTPAKDLQSGQQYKVTLASKGLRGVPQDLQPYQFSFRVQTPQFDVALQNLESDPADDQRMILRGAVTTSDAEDPAKIEQLVAITYLDSARKPVWTHSTDGLTHTFTVSDVQRQAEAKQITVKLDGKPIGSTHTGELQAQVPASGTFIVTDAQAREEAGRKQIRIYFSDSLADRQNLTGLVRLSAGEFTTSISSNMLVLYPKGELSGDVTVTLEPGIANERGNKLEDAVSRTLTFSSEKPQVRFVGSGVILPEGKVLSVPFEAVSARSVHVIATRIYQDNIAQFLQVNKLGGNYELGRVGRYLWRKTIPLTGPNTGRLTRYELDVTELMNKYPGSIFQLSLQLTPADSAYQCAAAGEGDTTAPNELELRNQEDGDMSMPSAWDFANDYFGVAEDEDGNYDYQARWNERKDPCKPAYFTYDANTRASRNLLASNLGLLAKSDQRGKLLVTVTDLRTAQPKSGVALTVRNYQNQSIATATSDSNGFATIDPNGTPFLLMAEASGQRGYLKLNVGNALPVSHFDVGGETISKGLKGIIYGERGVWRPGDEIHLTFVVQDKDKTLPANHPATLELSDPRGRVIKTLVNAKPVGGFYRFDVKTAADAPTGDWNAKVTLGGVAFSKSLKIETVMPNRLKIDMKFGKNGVLAGNSINGSIASQWLSGATAAGLKADVKLRLAPTATKFTRFTDYTFDDPAREFKTDPEDIFEGTLDAKGNAEFDTDLDLSAKPPGMLSATFTTRVFERGGAFSINRETTNYAPYARFVGIRLPKGDVARGMLQTDKDHVVELSSLSATGEPVALSKIKVSLYKVDWRWWWDRTGDSLAQYVQSRSNALVRSEVVSTDAKGQGQWKLRINYPEWGRYLIRACDEDGGHCTGSTFYIDWPSWAGKEREQVGPAATMLSVTTDKAKYDVGDTATIQLPESAQGRALVTIENGSSILDARWIEPKPGNTRFTVPVIASMAPNVYVAVTLVQPHENKNNDRPIRLYGVVPLEVTDPKTHIMPVIQAADEWQPESKPTMQVTEAKGRAMTYTLAVVDEGLLSLTNFKTPDLYQHFFKREALGIKTWDLFDEVVGAYGSQLERLLALGGSDAGKNDDDSSRSRFPPVVQVLGPFELQGGATAKHQISLPRYVGAVRVMVVAGDSSASTTAYGSAEKSIYVRQPLMILPTMPRVVGPNEEIAVPVSVFVANADIKNVALTIQPDRMFATVGEATTQVPFAQIEEKLGVLRLKAANRLGISKVKFVATSGKYRAESEINIEVRSSNPATARLQAKAIQPGESWTTTVVPHGLEGTNKVTLEMSAMPPLNIESRLRYLIQYPHGCLEQTTSSVFPQLFLPALVKLEDSRKREIEDNIRAAIERLRSFQLANGGFSYWPGGSGGFATGSLEGYSLWATTYASHFLVEAEKAGYSVPSSMRGGMIRHLQSVAQEWSSSPTSTANQGSTLDQAYRLYVLARAGQPEVGAMNRLREVKGLQDTERWVLAAAYQLAGLRDVAKAIAPSDPLAAREYKGRDFTFGSTLRDHAMVLQSLIVLGQLDKSQDLVKAISDDLSSDGWYSTQSTAYSLMAMAQLTGASNTGPFSFERSVAGKAQTLSSTAPVYQGEVTGIPTAGQSVTLRNTSQRVLFATIAVRGVPAAASEDADAAGLALNVNYVDDDGNTVDVSRLKQGTDVVMNVEVKNTTGLAIDNIALTQIMPAGWEIQNDRLEGAAATGEREATRKSPYDGSRESTRPKADYVDIRDDRVLQYFSLKSGESIRFTTRINAAYRGRYYLPSILTEAMYDASKHARTKGMWTEVVAQ